jgi:S1-C subfamily serine protease
MFRSVARLAAILSLMGLTFCGHPPRVPEVDRREVVNRIEDATVALVKPDEEDGGTIPYCSGVWIAEDKILTAKHCTDNGIDVEGTKMVAYAAKSDPEGGMHAGFVIADDEKEDVAVLRTLPKSTPRHTVARISTDTWPGQKLHIVGHTMGLWWSYIEGVVSSTEVKVKNPSEKVPIMMQVSSPAWFGNSGGGAFNEAGELVGMCSWVSAKAPFLTFFVRPTTIRDFLSKHHV